MRVIARIDCHGFVWIINRCKGDLILAFNLCSMRVIWRILKKMRRRGLSWIFNHASCNILLWLNATLHLRICHPTEHYVRVDSRRIYRCACPHCYRFLYVFILFLRYLKGLVLRSEMVGHYLFFGFKLIFHDMPVKWFMFEVEAIFIDHLLSKKNFLMISQKCGRCICVRKRLFLGHLWSLF